MFKEKNSKKQKDILIELDKREKKKQVYKAFKNKNEEQVLTLFLSLLNTKKAMMVTIL
ncbi:hypothetical protein [Bartonella raoultii]|uniref:hypothetical protein n=1 Tax=Bartonella raoultii TaxID=1457020 RepID=UPI001ABA571E|nr:hypothetical protein [Bartonella raoultii]